MKELVMVFDTNGTSKMTISIDNPKEEIALSDVQAAAEKLIPILITSSGAEITALNKPPSSPHRPKSSNNFFADNGRKETQTMAVKKNSL